MRVDILTLFPDSFSLFGDSMIKRAVANGIVELNITNIRDFAEGRHMIADDRLYGGGAGMVMKPEPIFAAVNAVKRSADARVVFTSPQGRLFDQKMAVELSSAEQMIIVCGHYEGIDERAIELLATDIVSIGDFVLTGGEIPAMAVTDAVVRLLPGVLGDAASLEEESFANHLLEYPHYTRPVEFMSKKVPEVLLSGNHQEISKWRKEQSVTRTAQRRPDLLEKADLSDEEMRFVETAFIKKDFVLDIALVHYPVYDKRRRTINTSVTNLDLHDIARASKTFSVGNFFIVQPLSEQRALLQSLLDYWLLGSGVRYNAYRSHALKTVRVVHSIDDAVSDIRERDGVMPTVIATSARDGRKSTGYRAMRETMETEGGLYLLLLGTGYGLTDEIVGDADFLLRPIYGRTAYNHLSVRSAASIMLDRLMGEKK